MYSTMLIYGNSKTRFKTNAISLCQESRFYVYQLPRKIPIQ
jgi:hypothetical protein